MQSKEQIVKHVAEIYDWIDSANQQDNNSCDACGKCCDFESYGHRLFVTTPEVMYLQASLGTENIKPMSGGICPYNQQGKCAIHKLRFAGCRIFFCKGNKDFQSELTEAALKKFKSLCEKFQVPYRYEGNAAVFANHRPHRLRP